MYGCIKTSLDLLGVVAFMAIFLGVLGAVLGFLLPPVLTASLLLAGCGIALGSMVVITGEILLETGARIRWSLVFGACISFLAGMAVIAYGVLNINLVLKAQDLLNVLLQ